MINLIRRNTPDIADRFVLETIEKEEGHSCYNVSVRGNKIVLGGDCKISQAMAYYRYLKDYCGVSLSHAGNTEMKPVTEAPLPDREIHKVIPQDKRAYMNYCTYGYSTAFWDWERWEKEIDFMAMNGINMPLFVAGSEAVWYYTMRELKYSETGALSFLSGPCFWPWQVMGNIYGYFPLTDTAYIDKKVELGKKIIERETALGMTPIQPGYSGFIPKSISRLFKGAGIRLVSSWSNFPPTYMVEPTDPLFRRFGMALLEKQRQLFGSFHYYACDPFHETKPNLKRKNYLWNVGRAIDNLYKDFDSESVWVMQAWSVYEPIIKAVPKGRLLVLDIDGEKYKETDGFWGHDFITGKILNFGNRSALHGNIRTLASNRYLDIKNEYENCVGTGFFPEGLDQNPMLFEMAFDSLTADTKIDLEPWLKSYALRRYNSDEDCLFEAVKILCDTCYGENANGRETGSVLCARPSTHLLHTAPRDTLEVRYDVAELLRAAELLTEAKNAVGDGYEYDVADVLRQAFSSFENILYTSCMDAYYSKNVDAFEMNTNRFISVAEDIDRLVSTRKEKTLSHNLSQASAYATNDKDKQNFELNLLCQITVWGPVNKPVNYDYAWKEWGGLITTFYAARWHSFFEQLAVYFTKKHYKTETKVQICERNLYSGSAFYRNYEKFEKDWLQTVNPKEPSEENTLEVAKELLEKNKKYITE